ncbi:MAG: hypothetical protein ABS46_18835 [Cytophagaceae bacterium SCN 52-12]|nr:MAG: hypothetical protein ABS46_18835 [Cytophagaceae bacterium SCN 52-12]
MDPTGAGDGIARITRGGSHSTGIPFLRSANRSAALPQTRSFQIGFRVVKGEKSHLSKPDPVKDKPLWAIGVRQENGWKKPAKINDKPFFAAPKTFARVSPEDNGPLYFIHNHEPALTALPNGDLLAIWFSTVTERGREMVIAGARLRKGAKEWDQPDIFFHVPDRNLTGQALWWDGEETVYHFSGVGTGDDWKRLSLVMRKSRDNGSTWSKPAIIGTEYEERHQPVDAVMKTSGGELVVLCDASWDGSGGTAVHVSTDNGLTWDDPGYGRPQPVFKEGKTGAWIAGIHAGIVELKDGRWLALGRGDEINDRMPMSISSDEGKSWVYSASLFPPVKSAQRLAMTRLKEGAIMLVSFEPGDAGPAIGSPDLKGRGMFAALSFDEGETWPVKKLITAESGMRKLTAPCNYRWGHPYDFLDSLQGEARGYLTVEQAPDGIIHVLSSGTHYSFNLKWITE